MLTLLKDPGYSARTLCETPGFSTVALPVPAPGIGANTAIFSVANSAVPRRLPYPNFESRTPPNSST